MHIGSVLRQPIGRKRCLRGLIQKAFHKRTALWIKRSMPCRITNNRSVHFVERHMLSKFISDATEYVDQRTNFSTIAAHDALLPVTFAFALTSLAAPKFSHTLLPAAFACLVLLQARAARRLIVRQSFEPTFTTIYFVFAALFLFVKAVTAPNPQNALALLTVFSAFLAMAWQMSGAFTELHSADQRKLSQGLLAGTLLGSVYLVIELLTSQSIVTSALNHIPLLAGGQKAIL